MKQDITVLNKLYTVTYQSHDQMCGSMGSVSRASGSIFIDNSVSTDQQCETLIHEVLHIIDEELKLNLDEVTIARLAVGLYSAGYGKR